VTSGRELVDERSPAPAGLTSNGKSCTQSQAEASSRAG